MAKPCVAQTSVHRIGLVQSWLLVVSARVSPAQVGGASPRASDDEEEANDSLGVRHETTKPCILNAGRRGVTARVRR